MIISYPLWLWVIIAQKIAIYTASAAQVWASSTHIGILASTEEKKKVIAPKARSIIQKNWPEKKKRLLWPPHWNSTYERDNLYGKAACLHRLLHRCCKMGTCVMGHFCDDANSRRFKTFFSQKKMKVVALNDLSWNASLSVEEIFFHS